MKKIIYTLFIFPLFIFSQEVSVADGATLTIGTSGSMTVSSSITTNNTGTILITSKRIGSLIAKMQGLIKEKV